MDATRAEVERELKRIRNCIENVRLRITQHKNYIKRLAQGDFGDFDAALVANRMDWMKQDERDELQYRYVERILTSILERTQELSAVEGGE